MLKTNKRQTIIIHMVDNKIYMKHYVGNVELSVDVTPIFNFGQFVQKVLEHPEDDHTTEYIDLISNNTIVKTTIE